MLKRCRICKNQKVDSDFRKDKSHRDGLSTACKACLNEQRPKGVGSKAPRPPRGEVCVVCKQVFIASTSRQKACPGECKDVMDAQRERGYDRSDKPRNKAKARIAAIKSKYGLTQEAFEALHRSQGGHCFFCSRTHLHVDHDHTTGRVRGLLCPRHNMILSFIDSVGDSEWEQMRAYARGAVPARKVG